MPAMQVNGCTIHYEVMGTGVPLVFTPGSRNPKSIMRPVVERLVPPYQGIIYDRRNCGASDITITGDQSEQEIWSDDLAQLIKQLGIGPAYIGGWSAGCRVSLLTAIRYPEVVKGLLLGWVTGGSFAAQRLAHRYYGKFIEAAEKGGMQAVVDTPYFGERIAENPGNRDRLLSMNKENFVEVMSRWQTFFLDGAELPVIGATEEQLKSIRVPTVIISGDDDTHTLTAAQALHSLLPNSQFHDPVIRRDEWNRLQQGPQEILAEIRAERAVPYFTAFLEKVEGKYAIAGD